MIPSVHPKLQKGCKWVQNKSPTVCTAVGKVCLNKQLRQTMVLLWIVFKFSAELHGRVLKMALMKFLLQYTITELCFSHSQRLDMRAHHCVIQTYFWLVVIAALNQGFRSCKHFPESVQVCKVAAQNLNEFKHFNINWRNILL